MFTKYTCIHIVITGFNCLLKERMFNIPENPFAIRISEETKELFNKLANEGDFENKGEFLNRLLTMYQSEDTKKSVSMLKPAIEAVDALTNRLLEILNGTGAIITTNEEKQKQELDRQRTSFEETRELLQRRIATLERDHVEDEERIKSFLLDKEQAEWFTKELQARIGELEAIVTDKQDLINEYKEKLDTQMTIANEYRRASEENKGLINDVNNNKQVNISLQQELDKLKQDQEKQIEISRQEKDNLKTALLLEKEAALLDLKTQYQGKIEEQQARHAATIGQYENKVRELLGMTEQEKPTELIPSASMDVPMKPVVNKKPNAKARKKPEAIQSNTD